ncbi:hypothetical protein ACQZV8_15185 [Magnetococcales bacterium HHB-1]
MLFRLVGYMILIALLWINVQFLEQDYRFILKWLQEIIPQFWLTAVISMILFWGTWHKKFQFWETLLHELTHVIFALLTFNRPHALSVEGSGDGHASYIGKGNWLITLSPYLISLPTLFLILITPLIAWQDRAWIGHALIVSQFFFWAGLSRQFRWSQPDIQKGGLIFSTLLIINFNTLFALFFISYLASQSIYFFNALLTYTQTLWNHIEPLIFQ